MYFVAFLSIFSFSTMVHGKQAATWDYLIGEGDLDGVRIAYRPFEKTIDQSAIFGLYDFTIETSASYLNFDGQGERQSNTIVSFSPIFSKQIATLSHVAVKLEIGIGLAYVRDTRLARKDLGTHYQFEDRVGLIFDIDKLGKKALALRYFHYSNGGLDAANPGLDFLNLSYFSYF